MKKRKIFNIWHLILIIGLPLVTSQLSLVTARAQGTPGTVRCPGAVDTLDSLFRITDAARTSTTHGLTSSATEVEVTSTSVFPSSGSIKIDNEIIYYTGTTPTTFTGLIRGASSTTAAAHVSGALVSSPIIAAHHDTLAQAVICAQTLGLNAVPQTATVNGHALSANVVVTPSDLTQDSTHRFVSDTEKSTWNGKQDADSDLTTIGALTPSNDDIIQRKAGAWTNRTLAQLKTDLNLIGTNTGDQVVPANTTSTSHQFFTAYNSTTGVFTKAQPAASDISGLATSATTDTTNPANITQDSTHRFVSDTEKSTWNGKQDADSDLTTIGALTPSNDDIIQRKAGAWTNRTLAQLKTDLNLSGANTGDQVVPANTTSTSHQFFSAYNSTTGVFTKAQPAASDITGLATSATTDTTTSANIADSTDKRFVTDAQRTVIGNTSGTNTGDQVVPANTTSTSHQFFTAYNSTTGVFTKAQPAASDITGLATSATTDTTTTANITDATNKRFVTDAQRTVIGNTSGTNTGDQVVPANTTSTSHQFFTAYNSTTGVFTKAQPAASDISGLATSATTDTTNPANITQDSTHRFVSDTEKSTWNGKQNALPAFSQTGADVSIDTAGAGSISLNSVGHSFSAGDIFGTGNNATVSIDDSGNDALLGVGGTYVDVKGGLDKLILLQTVGEVVLGDYNHAGHQTALEVDDVAQTVEIAAANGATLNGSSILSSFSIGVYVQGYDADLTTIGALTPTNDDVIQRKAGAWTNRTLAQLKTDLTLNNVDNTSDATKNAASVTLTNKTISGASNTLSNIGNSSLSNSSITIAGTSTSLGGSITQDTITGLSSTGLLKRTGANTLAIATPGTDYPNPVIYAQVSGSDATTTGQALVDVTGLSVALAANTTYEIHAVLMTTTSADASGTRYGVNFSAAGATIEAGVLGTRTSTSAAGDRISAFNTSSSSYMTTSSQSGTAVIQGTVVVGANLGNLTIQHLKITSGTSTVRIGSFVWVRKIS